MQNDVLLTDDYVADLLVKEAGDRSLRYSAMGLEAFNDKPKPSNAPKPNTKFLRHIIRDTDSHNRALLAREAAESRARLQDLERSEEARRRRANPRSGEIRRRQLGDIQSILGGRSRGRVGDREKRGHKHEKDDENKGKHGDERCARRTRGEAEGASRRSRRREDDLVGGDNEGRRSYGRLSRGRQDGDEDEDEDEGGRLSKRSHREKSGQSSKRSRRHDEGSSDEEGSGRRHRHRSKREGSRSPAHRHRHRHRHRSHSRSRSRSRSKSPQREKRSKHRHRSPMARQEEEEEEEARKPTHDESDSDPLDDLIGPAPPPKYRGRGRVAGAAGMDMRFSEAYDPRADVEPAEEGAGGQQQQQQQQQQGAGWEDAMEAYRDRQKLRQVQESRMRAAGFGEQQIRRLGGGQGQKERERTEEDVVWAKAGEEREWDRGKGDDGVRGVLSEE